MYLLFFLHYLDFSPVLQQPHAVQYNFVTAVKTIRNNVVLAVILSFDVDTYGIGDVFLYHIYKDFVLQLISGRLRNNIHIFQCVRYFDISNTAAKKHPVKVGKYAFYRHGSGLWIYNAADAFYPFCFGVGFPVTCNVICSG